MKIKLAATADFANVTREGKLNIIGVFDRVMVPSLPFVLPMMQLILRLEVSYAERDRPHKVEITFDDPNGKRLMTMGAELRVGIPRAGHTGITDQILALGNVRFESEGGHTFNFFIDGDLKDPLTLEVELTPKQDQPRLPGV